MARVRIRIIPHNENRNFSWCVYSGSNAPEPGPMPSMLEHCEPILFPTAQAAMIDARVWCDRLGIDLGLRDE